ncbi:MAG: hypothetical protein CO028_04860 [Candidatus Levybacteria bacterium CG_4_9_14_0_2_um_filter_35_21]|nr:MAG: hypothetical protein COW87_00220 [Candidatus Levybacteria bacterium CG22_combo_CG10-13_8_21_14_all_35_11]PJC53970.1 MAG: hypothetical protein CO028_04860 [Candidatus Levybacteria bacterium CG_4_9_14_0_2_um_filter_35_21]
MLTKNDLSAIQKLVRIETSGVEKRLGERIYKLDGKIDVIQVGLNAKIDKVQESVDIVQNVVIEHYDKLDKRVAQIEDHLNLPSVS